MEATSFFYRTINRLLEGSYNSEEGSVSEKALEKFRKYEPQLGDKCWAYIHEDSSGFFLGIACFPSGKIFDVVIIRTGNRWVLDYFYPRKWDLIWREVLYDIERDSILRPKRQD
jgi:hypothetical protein